MLGRIAKGRVVASLALALVIGQVSAGYTMADPKSSASNAAAAATSAVTWTSPFIIQDVGTTNATSVTVEFVDVNGNLVNNCIQQLGALNVGASVAVRPQNLSCLTAGQYSVVISSDADVAAVVNSAAGTMNASYDGLSATKIASTNSVSFPNVLRNYAGFDSPIYIQNAQDPASGTATVVTAKFFQFSNGTLAATQTNSNLKPGQTWTLDPATVSGLSDNTQYAVVATSNPAVPLAGVVNQIESSNVAADTYSGFSGTAGSGKTLYLPNITRNYFGFNTPFIVQNVGTGSTNVTASYYSFTGALVTSDGPHAVGQGLSYPFRPWTTNGLSDNSQYSVIVTSDTQPVVVMVNEQTSDLSQFMDYSGFAAGTTTIDLPNITRNYFGFNTPFIVQNVTSGTTANVTANYYSFATGQLVHTDGPHAVAYGQSYPFRPNTTSGLSDGTQYSVVVTSDQPVVAVVNQQNSNGDSMAYDGLTP
jgi:hypothetical protein